MNQNLSCIPDCSLQFSLPIKQDQGEDCCCRCVGQSATLVAALDGCGGSGARRHDWYSGKTEAYMASRLVAGALHDVFFRVFPLNQSPVQAARTYLEALRPEIDRRLDSYRPPAGATAFKGRMFRTLPCTLAAALVQREESGRRIVTVFWAGDSRVYLLTANGLMQLTRDNSGTDDPFENTYTDDVMNNVISQDRDYQIHRGSVGLSTPFVLFAATDGAYGYVPSPMEFEGLLLSTLDRSASPDQWEQEMTGLLKQFTEDDCSMSMAFFGYRDFARLKQDLAPRYRFLQEQYLSKLKDIPLEEKEARRAYWQTYQTNYLKFVKDES